MKPHINFNTTNAFIFLLFSLIISCTSGTTTLFAFKEGDLWGYYDADKKLVITPHFDNADDFKYGIAIVYKHNKCGYIKDDGHYLIQPQFEKCREFYSDELAPVKVKGSWGYINKSGKMIIPPVYESAEPFYGYEKALVKHKNSTVYIDKEGNRFGTASDTESGIDLKRKIMILIQVKVLKIPFRN